MPRKSKKATKVYKKQYIADLKARGICTACAANPAEQDKSQCRGCLDKSALCSKAHRQDLRREVIHAYGGVCACCGEKEIKFLTIDHINGGGRDHRKKFVGYDYVTSGAPFYSALKRAGWPSTEGLQVLCWNCNVAKFHYGMCPHHGGMTPVVE